MLGFTNSVTGGEENKISCVSWETGCLERAGVSCQRHEDGKAKKRAGGVRKREQTYPHSCMCKTFFSVQL